MLNDDEDGPQLSSHTLSALLEFYKEQAERDKTKGAQLGGRGGNYDEFDFDEDWQLSQFWYDEDTISTIANIVNKSVETRGKIALISCPTLYRPLKNQNGKNYEITLFEFDQRFATFGSDFISYDYRSPLHIPEHFASHFDLVIADPPFLSEECLTKITETMKYICNKKMILCTGITMSDVAKVLLNMEKSSFEPKHKNNLANEFCCLSNINIDSLL